MKRDGGGLVKSVKSTNRKSKFQQTDLMASCVSEMLDSHPGIPSWSCDQIVHVENLFVFIIIGRTFSQLNFIHKDLFCFKYIC